MAVAAFGPAVTGVARKVPAWPVYLIGMMPGAWLLYRAVAGQLGFDPVKTLELELGLLSLQFLLASLTISPLLRFFRINLLKFRKVLGLLAFGYIALHFLVWLTLDLQLRWTMIGAEIAKRPYLTVGFAAFVLLIPLAATSWQGAIRRLGAKAWGRLHRLVYVAVLLGGVHFVMQEKVWTVESLTYLGAAILLVGARFAWIRRW
ncbi:protein-methionine-sulfoxide reductase heme-binding subunit MsrQ [Jannaschia rubra]|uniref:Protein-methionine-sulfoxide reductase heme-binding subunit MsrQ n=1 Tax=Jannaschia rubra TaxID=282197 RepID=A0A0M6XP37_9RHOB|nr:protein-methionine-sulfoxide reductase heme-binding subunit MsrQ [Jannaschia rubra]CTQ32442.1 Flavocytochrome YedZ [Jannaschia rubra]SFF82303.1 sulfoxide reductase heme-binding subunit YedZ [Jannaschia rubra]